MHAAKHYFLRTPGSVFKQTQRHFSEKNSNTVFRSGSQKGKVLIAGVAAISLTTTGIVVTGQFSERTEYERNILNQSKVIEKKLQDKGLTLEGWHGISHITFQESNGNPLPQKNPDGSIPISRLSKAAACSGHGGKLYPAVSIRNNPPVENVSVGEFSGRRRGNKQSTDAPDITSDAWQKSITLAGQRSGRAFVLLPAKQREMGINEDISLTDNAPKSVLHDVFNKNW